MKRVVAFILAAMLGQAADIPKTLISEDEAEPIHSAIVRKETWTTDAVRRIRLEADKRMKEGPWTVTSDRPLGLGELDTHDYYSEAPYWWPDLEHPDGPYIRKDGVMNPSRFTSNKTSLNAMCDAVFTLGMAAYLLDDTRYGQRAARVIQAWFINPRTRMNPDLEYAQAVRGVNNGRGAGILDGRVFIRAIQGMEFLAQTTSWEPKDQAAVHRWFEDYLRWLTTSKNASDEKHSGNNHASWWTAQTAAVATFVQNMQAQEMAFKFYRDSILPRQIRADGSAPREETRTRSLSYSVFNLEAYTMVCRIAQVQGVNLWTVRGKGGATIETVIDYLDTYLADPHKWAKEQISEFPNDGLYFLAYAGIGLKKPDYVALFRKLERPDTAWLGLTDLVVSRWEASAHQTRH